MRSRWDAREKPLARVAHVRLLSIRCVSRVGWGTCSTGLALSRSLYNAAGWLSLSRSWL